MSMDLLKKILKNHGFYGMLVLKCLCSGSEAGCDLACDDFFKNMLINQLNLERISGMIVCVSTMSNTFFTERVVIKRYE